MSLVTGGLLKGFVSAAGSAPTAPTLAMADDADGTVTATITGADAGTTNTVYTFPSGGGTKTSQGSRSANGTVDITIDAGVYYWQVESDDGSGCTNWSNTVLLRATDGTDAVYERILTQVLSDLQGIGMSGTTSTDFFIQKVPEKRDGHGFPQFVICPLGAERHNPNDTQPTKKDDIEYTVFIGCIDSGNEDQTTNRDRWLKWRQDISRTFRNQVLTTVTEVYTGFVTYRDVVDSNAWFDSGDLVGGIEIKFMAREVRTL